MYLSAKFSLIFLNEKEKYISLFYNFIIQL